MFLFPLPSEKKTLFFSSVWSVCKIMRNKLMRWEGRVVPTFDFSVLQRGFWWGLCSTFPVASQTFLVLFCQVTEPRGSVQPHRVKHSLLISLMGHSLDWHLPANKGLKGRCQSNTWDQEFWFVLQAVVIYLHGDLCAKCKCQSQLCRFLSVSFSSTTQRRNTGCFDLEGSVLIYSVLITSHQCSHPLFKG